MCPSLPDGESLEDISNSIEDASETSTLKYRRTWNEYSEKRAAAELRNAALFLKHDLTTILDTTTFPQKEILWHQSSYASKADSFVIPNDTMMLQLATSDINFPHFWNYLEQQRMHIPELVYSPTLRDVPDDEKKIVETNTVTGLYVRLLKRLETSGLSPEQVSQYAEPQQIVNVLQVLAKGEPVFTVNELFPRSIRLEIQTDAVKWFTEQVWKGYSQAGRSMLSLARYHDMIERLEQTIEQSQYRKLLMQPKDTVLPDHLDTEQQQMFELYSQGKEAFDKFIVFVEVVNGYTQTPRPKEKIDTMRKTIESWNDRFIEYEFPNLKRTDENTAFAMLYREALNFMQFFEEEDRGRALQLLWSYLDIVGRQLKGESYDVLKEIVIQKNAPIEDNSPGYNVDQNTDLSQGIEVVPDFEYTPKDPSQTKSRFHLPSFRFRR